MAKKAAIVKKYALSANGILAIEEDMIGVENLETGEFIDLKDLLKDFKDKDIKLSVTYDEDYGAEAE